MSSIIVKGTKNAAWHWPMKDELGYSCSSLFYVDGQVIKEIKQSEDINNLNLTKTVSPISGFASVDDIDQENYLPYLHTGWRDKYYNDHDSWANRITDGMAIGGGTWVHFVYNRISDPSAIAYIYAGVKTQVDLNCLIETMNKLPNLQNAVINFLSWPDDTGFYMFDRLNSRSLKALLIQQNNNNDGGAYGSQIFGLDVMRCPNLEVLELHGGQDYNEKNYISPGILANFPNLRVFSMTTSWCYVMGDLRGYCMAMPNIEYLALDAGRQWDFIQSQHNSDWRNWGLYGDIRNLNFLRKLKKVAIWGFVSAADPDNCLGFLNNPSWAPRSNTFLDPVRTWTRADVSLVNTDEEGAFDYEKTKTYQVADWGTTNIQLASSWFNDIPNTMYWNG